MYSILGKKKKNCNFLFFSLQLNNVTQTRHTLLMDAVLYTGDGFECIWLRNWK